MIYYQTYRLVDGAGNFFITLKQNAIASGSEYESDSSFWGKLVKRTWKNYPKLKVFEKGYNKDYIYEERINISKIGIEKANSQSPPYFKNKVVKLSKKGYVAGIPIILLTMCGAIKFNMWKRTEGGKMIAFALIER